MGDLSAHFDRSEFACRGAVCCGGAAPISERLVAALELLRELASSERPGKHVQLAINSGFRCLTHNRSLGSPDTSQHPLGLAADVRPIGVSVSDLARTAEQIPDFEQGGIGLYCNFVHLDVRRDGPARW